LFAVADGSDRIELVEAEGPDIVILDLDLPSMDGFDLLK
jgi:DNA-binding response OmpR family regulator